ncbi:hypothetical protein Pmar_PMAR015201 [Perkinsus marinus ATCC 50983]|uniref:Uncharacterized protein n=1 Tax=Perkinsus marinus (strain ATCC 50983 / TXsc) TaxID=423536 RepID=C5K5P5_PERM5|nr:hypothetical protein Pmar_PMAR015201 [Perkinsus marinus ATCC 50983]EER20202.1 hypothetical protein Pmar_PMAR015201 [Perkinsus marinus ATCC 50983]|eukprot:XP_002788406.1 hypothetical protein Pmar_PMAR015201 [Perkinsus marinus ATCC 50983]
MLTHFIVILPLLLTVDGKQQFKQVLCDINLEQDGKVFDETICLVKDSEDRRSILLIEGLSKSTPPTGKVFNVEAEKPGRGGKNSRKLTITTPVESKDLMYHGQRFKTSPLFVNGDSYFKSLTLSSYGRSDDHVHVVSLTPIRPGDQRVERCDRFISTDGTVRLEAYHNVAYFEWRISYLLQGVWSKASKLKVKDYILKSELSTFKGTFYDLHPGHEEHIVMLATHNDKTILLFKEE